MKHGYKPIHSVAGATSCDESEKGGKVGEAETPNMRTSCVREMNVDWMLSRREGHQRHTRYMLA